MEIHIPWKSSNELDFFSQEIRNSFSLKNKIKPHRNFSFHGIYHVCFKFLGEDEITYCLKIIPMDDFQAIWNFIFAEKWSQTSSKFQFSWLSCLFQFIFFKDEIIYCLKIIPTDDFQAIWNFIFAEKKHTKNLSADIKLLAFMVY